MKKHDWLDEELPQSFPRFSEARHSVLCSELKQLYVAITRARQRLWICENKEELSKPMFNLWKRRGLVQIRKLDESVAQAMREASSPQEWRDRGKKLFYEGNFVMATMCFERAGDTMWEKLAKASGLKASADQMRETNYEAFLGYLKEAAGMFESVGKHDSAALCYYDLGEYEKAGKIYLYTCQKMDAAAECFTLAGCYSDAAEAYFEGNQFSSCLSVCKKGKLFNKGLQILAYWKEQVEVQSEEIEQIEQEFLEKCALDHHEHKDHKSMMKLVRAFSSMESKRMFLRSLNCLDDLLLLEEETGHYLEAAELARSWGDVLKEADLLEKAGSFKEATVLLLWYVFVSSLWENGNRGWPLKQFSQKEQLCEKTKSLAKMESDFFHDFVCNELQVVSAQNGNLIEIKKHLHVSRENKSVRGEFLSIRKILDYHFNLSSSDYEWENELPTDIIHHRENPVSLTSLVFYWRQWKEKVTDIFSSLESFHKKEPGKHKHNVEFCLDYFGVKKMQVNGNTVYLLVNKNADWIRKNSLDNNEKLPTIDGMELVLAIRSYWQTELQYASTKVLEALKSLYKSKSNGSTFHQSTSLLHIFEVSKFLLDCKYLNLNFPAQKTVKDFLKISTSDYYDLVFPLDWRKSMCDDLTISLMSSDLSVNLLDEIIIQHIDSKTKFSSQTIVKVVMICLFSKKSLALHDKFKIWTRGEPKWKAFIEEFNKCGLKEVSVVKIALLTSLKDNWNRPGCMPPHTFVHLFDRLVFTWTVSSQTFVTTKSSFVGWLTQLDPNTTTLSSAPIMCLLPDDFMGFFVDVIDKILFDEEYTVSWIRRSKIEPSYYHPLLALKMVMILSLMSLMDNRCKAMLTWLLFGERKITHLLPDKFVGSFLKAKVGDDLALVEEVVAEAFMSIGDPLVIVCTKFMRREFSNVPDTSAIFLDVEKSKDEIMKELFPERNENTSSG